MTILSKGIYTNQNLSEKMRLIKFSQWPDQILINKKRTCHLVDFAVLADQQKMKESKKIALAWELEGDGDTNYSWHTRNNSQRLGKTGDQRKDQDYKTIAVLKLARILSTFTQDSSVPQTSNQRPTNSKCCSKKTNSGIRKKYS